jgi:hypothetical protein
MSYHPTCSDPACQRPQVRTREGLRWCMFHPDQQPPDVDPISGKLRGPNGKPKGDPKPSEILRPSSAAGYRAPGRVATRPRPAPTTPAAQTGHRGAPHAGWTEQVSTKLTPAEVAALRLLAGKQGQKLSEYLRNLVHADLRAWLTEAS